MKRKKSVADSSLFCQFHARKKCPKKVRDVAEKCSNWWWYFWNKSYHVRMEAVRQCFYWIFSNQRCPIKVGKNYFCLKIFLKDENRAHWFNSIEWVFKMQTNERNENIASILIFDFCICFVDCLSWTILDPLCVEQYFSLEPFWRTQSIILSFLVVCLGFYISMNHGPWWEMMALWRKSRLFPRFLRKFLLKQMHTSAKTTKIIKIYRYSRLHATKQFNILVPSLRSPIDDELQCWFLHRVLFHWKPCNQIFPWKLLFHEIYAWSRNEITMLKK